jgi:hypothetical protein
MILEWSTNSMRSEIQRPAERLRFGNFWADNDALPQYFEEI